MSFYTDGHCPGSSHFKVKDTEGGTLPFWLQDNACIKPLGSPGTITGQRIRVNRSLEVTCGTISCSGWTSPGQRSNELALDPQSIVVSRLLYQEDGRRGGPDHSYDLQPLHFLRTQSHPQQLWGGYHQETVYWAVMLSANLDLLKVEPGVVRRDESLWLSGILEAKGLVT